MKKHKHTAQSRGQQAVNRAIAVIDAAGWQSSLQKHDNGRFVAVKRITEREDDSTTSLFESDYTIEGLAATVTRREREEGRK